jgi:hypothetical protein
MSTRKLTLESSSTKKDIRSLKGIIKSPSKKSVSVREMNRAIAEGFSGT